MSIETNVNFNRAMREIAEKYRNVKEQRIELEQQLKDINSELTELEADIERECIWYIERFDRNSDGCVTPLEVIKTIFSDISTQPQYSPKNTEHTQKNTFDAIAIVKAMFTADTNGNAIVNVDEFTRTIKNNVLGLESTFHKSYVP